MVILHIATVKDNQADGVCVLVPKLIRSQMDYATVGLLNLTQHQPQGITNCFYYSSSFSLKDLKEPFNKPDIVVFHQIYNLEFIKISKIMRKEKIPYIILPHGSLTLEAQKTRRWKKILGNTFLFNKFLKGATAFQCVSEVEALNSKTSAEKFVGKSGWTMPMKSKKTFNKDKIKFVYIGRLDYHIKGLDIMLDAFELLRATPYKDKCELRIYGPDYQGRYNRVKQMIADRLLGELVTLNPPIFDEEKEKVLLESDVFIQTSRTESLTLGILEALSYGLPCLVTPGTTWGDGIINYNAGWVAQPTKKDVFDKIVCVIDDNELFEEKSKNAMALVKDNFSWKENAKQSLEKYRSYLDS